jgi:glycosyltransferase involved in cell wall biosynthesis
MKIALIDPVGGHGGMDYYDYGLANGLSNNGVEVVYFTCSETKNLIPSVVEKKDVFANIWKKRKLLKLFFLLRGYYRAMKISKRKGIRIAHYQFFHLGVQNVLALYIAKLFSIKRVVTLHDVDSFRSNEMKFVQKLGLKLSDKLIVHNTFSKEELLSKNIDSKKIMVIPHGNYFPFVKDLEYEQCTTSVPLRLLFFGQIKKVKGLEVLLQAMKELYSNNTPVHLTIAGRPWGTDAAYYAQQIEELGIRSLVEYKFEYIPNEEVESYFHAADIIVLPYKKIYQSGVLLLSMSYGRVTLSSDLPPFREIIQDNKNGFLFESENSISLASKIEEIYLKKDQLGIVRNNALNELKSTFDWSNIGKSTKKIYESI